MAATVSAFALPIAKGEKDDEKELVRLAQNGVESAFEKLVHRHQHRICALVSSILRRQDDVEDIAQQVFLKVFLSLKRFDHRATFSTWVYRITVNECWDYLRKKKARPLVYESDLSEEQVSRLDGIVSAERPPQSADHHTEIKDFLEQVLEKVPEQDRQLLILKEMEGFSVQELAEIFDLNANTVKVRVFRARGRIMEAYRRRLAPTHPGSFPAAEGKG